MAVLSTDQVGLCFADGTCARTVLLSVKNTTAGDTADLAQWLKVIKRCGLVSDTGTTIASCSIAGTVITIPAGPSSDGVWVLAVGVAV
jgi:hypothetical protein